MAGKKKKANKAVKPAATNPQAAPQQVIGGDAPPGPKVPAPPPISSDASYAERIAALNAVANSLNEEHHKVLVRGDEAPNPYILRRPTGIMELDIQLGGGFPAGGLCFVSGPENGGKTWLMMQTLAMQQKLYGDNCIVAMAVTEGGFPYDQALRVGLHVGIPDEMILQWQRWKEQRGFPTYNAQEIAYFKKKVGEFVIIRGSTGEEVLTALLEVVKTRACSVVCLDSIQGLQPEADADKDITEADRFAAHAVLMGKFFKRYIPTTTGLDGMNDTTVLMTQQVRSNKAKAEASTNIQKYLKDWAVTSGWAARHFKLIDLVLYDGSVTKKDVPGQGKVATGKELKWEFEKGKAGCHDHQNGVVQYSYEIAQGVDFVGTVMDAAMQRGVLRKVGSKYVLIRPEDQSVLDGYAASNLTAFRRCMELDPEFEMAVRREILASAGLQCLYR